MPSKPRRHRPPGQPTYAQQRREYDQRRDTQEWRRWYKTAAWSGKNGIRTQRLKIEPVCRMCRQAGKVTPASVVDHVKEHKGDRALFFDLANTQSLCKPHHDSSKQREEGRGYSNAVSEDGWPIDARHPANRHAGGGGPENWTNWGFGPAGAKTFHKP